MPGANRLFLWFLGTLLLAGVAWYGYWFATHFEQQVREVRSDLSPEARRNRFLAAELFLRRNGREVVSERRRDIFNLQPGPHDTILLGNFASLFIERNDAALLQWVREGGHLIFVPFERDEEEAPLTLLEALGVEVGILTEEEDIELHCEDSLEPCRDADAEEGEARRVTVTFGSEHPGEFRATFSAERYLEDTQEQATTVVGDAVMPNLLRYTLGHGTVTVLSDNELFSNTHIGEHDHAYLLSRLVAGEGRTWIFYSAEMPTLLERLWQQAPYLTLLTPLLLLMAGWRMLLRSGPRLHTRFGERRNLLEHLDAGAGYSWRIDRAMQLFITNRDSVEQGWRRRHPHLNTLDEAQRCAWIGERSGLAPRAVERTLYHEQGSEQDFIRASAVLQRLATGLGTGGAAGVRSVADKGESQRQ